MGCLSWIQVEKEFLRGRAVIALRAHLGVSRHEAVGLSCDVWAWCSDNAPTGEFSGEFAVTAFEEAAGWQGKPGKFWEACLKAEIVEGRPDAFRVRGMGRYGKAIAKAMKERERKQRARSGAVSVAVPASVAASSVSSSASVSADSPRDIPSDGAVPVEGKKLDLDLEKDFKDTHSTSATPPPSVGPEKPDSTAFEKPPQPSELQQLWNALAAPCLPRWEEMTEKRLKAAKARLRKRGIDGPRGFREVIERINASPFLLGEGKTGWRADADWLLQPDSAAKVLEGKYDDARNVRRPSAGTSAGPRHTGPAGEQWHRVLDALKADGRAVIAQQLEKLVPLEFDAEAGRLVARAPDAFFVGWVETNCLDLVHELTGIELVVFGGGVEEAVSA